MAWRAAASSDLRGGRTRARDHAKNYLLKRNQCVNNNIVSKQNVLGSPIEQFARMMFSRIIAGLARTLHEEDFSVAQVAALHLVDQEGAMRVTALATSLGLSASAGSRLADGLVQRGLLAREEDPEDRRAKTLALTPLGRRFVDRASVERVRVIMETARSLPEEISAAMLTAVRAFRRE